MLPLMNSRMSASLAALPSSISSDRRHDLPGRAVAALEGVVRDEGPLHRVQVVAVGEALDRRDLVTLARDGEREAGEHAPAVDPDRARAAGALVAALLLPVRSRCSRSASSRLTRRLDVDDVVPAVDLEHDGLAGRGGGPGLGCVAWFGNGHVGSPWLSQSFHRAPDGPPFASVSPWSDLGTVAENAGLAERVERYHHRVRRGRHEGTPADAAHDLVRTAGVDASADRGAATAP